MGRKQLEVAELQARAPALDRAAEAAPAPRAFAAALRLRGTVALITEFKRRSPSAGAIWPGEAVSGVAGQFEAAGASAISVLTDSAFDGAPEDLVEVRRATRLPVLRKDFILDAVQVTEARAAGADAVLLIVRALGRAPLRALLDAARHWGLAALVEVHDERELGTALDLGAEIIGINNRDLDTFATDLGVTERLVPFVPAHALVVAESGFQAPEEVRRVGALGVDAVLVGESILASPDPAQAAARLVGLPKRDRG